MVIGLEKFREYFTNFPGSYVIIGGTACDIVIGAAGLKPRATKDIDIILIIEALTPDFVRHFGNLSQMVIMINVKRVPGSASIIGSLILPLMISLFR